MVSSFSYLSLKQVDVAARVKYSYIAFVILPMLIMIRIDPAERCCLPCSCPTRPMARVHWLARRLRPRASRRRGVRQCSQGSLRNAYLDALGIDRWVPRHGAAEPAALPETGLTSRAPEVCPVSA
jgi:hypothetical protein